MRTRHQPARERRAVLQGELRQRRQDLWTIVIETRNGWHRYQHSQLYDTVEHRQAFRHSVIFGLRRFGEELTALLLSIATDVDRRPTGAPLDVERLVMALSAPVTGVRPRVIPPGLRHTLTRYLAAVHRTPAELPDDELRVLAVGLWGVWDQLEDGLREFGQWLTA